MKKYYKMDKAKGEAWVKALRSGDYKQGAGFLIQSEDEVAGDLSKTHCCLGVLACLNVKKEEEVHLTGIPGFTDLDQFHNPKEMKVFSEIPFMSDLEHYENILDVLMVLNDGGPNPCDFIFNDEEEYKEDSKCSLFKVNVNTEEGVRAVRSGFSFKQIADFIELNFEFVKDYEEKNS